MISPGIFDQFVWYTCVSGISRYTFHFFEMLIFLAVRGGGVKGRKIALNEKYRLHPSYTISQKQYSLWSWFSVHIVNWWYVLVVFFFFYIYIFIFQAVRWVKGQKNIQNEKCKLHPSHTISQEQYSLWSWFLVHLCKLMISPGVFFFFFIYIFPFFGLLKG